MKQSTTMDRPAKKSAPHSEEQERRDQEATGIGEDDIDDELEDEDDLEDDDIEEDEV